MLQWRCVSFLAMSKDQGASPDGSESLSEVSDQELESGVGGAGGKHGYGVHGIVINAPVSISDIPKKPSEFGGKPKDVDNHQSWAGLG